MAISKECTFTWDLLKRVIKAIARNEGLQLKNYSIEDEVAFSAIYIHLKGLSKGFLTDATMADSFIKTLNKALVYSIRQGHNYMILFRIAVILYGDVLGYLKAYAENFRLAHLDNINATNQYDILARYPFITLYSPNNDAFCSGAASFYIDYKPDPYCYISTRLYREVIMPFFDLLCNETGPDTVHDMHSVMFRGLYGNFIYYGYHHQINPFPACVIDPNFVMHLMRYYKKKKLVIFKLVSLFNKDDLYEFCKLCIQERDLYNLNYGIELYMIRHRHEKIKRRDIFYKAALVDSRMVLSMVRLGCDERVSLFNILMGPYKQRKPRGCVIEYPHFKLSKRCYIHYDSLIDIVHSLKIIIRYHNLDNKKQILSQYECNIIDRYFYKV